MYARYHIFIGFGWYECGGVGDGVIHQGMKMKQKQRKEVRGRVWDKETIDKGASGPRSSALRLAFNVRIFQCLFGSGVWDGGRIGQCYPLWHKNDICQISFWASWGVEFSRKQAVPSSCDRVARPRSHRHHLLSFLGTLTRCPAWHLRAATQPSLPVCHFYVISVLVKVVWDPAAGWMPSSHNAIRTPFDLGLLLCSLAVS